MRRRAMAAGSTPATGVKRAVERQLAQRHMPASSSRGITPMAASSASAIGRS